MLLPPYFGRLDWTTQNWNALICEPIINPNDIIRMRIGNLGANDHPSHPSGKYNFSPFSR